MIIISIIQMMDVVIVEYKLDINVLIMYVNLYVVMVK